MGENVAAEIEKIRARLEEITDEREHRAEDSYSRHEELLEEEHRLEARLTSLEDTVAGKTSGEAEEEAARQTDLTRPPKLPEDPEDQ